MTPEQMRKVSGFSAGLGNLKAKQELGQGATLTADEVAGIIWAINSLRRTPGAKADTITAAGDHQYWSTHCRHDRHQDCAADELAPGVPRRPAQCKTCAAPCTCRCHRERP